MTLQDYLAGRMDKSPSAKHKLELHLANCHDCKSELTGLDVVTHKSTQTEQKKGFFEKLFKRGSA